MSNLVQHKFGKVDFRGVGRATLLLLAHVLEVLFTEVVVEDLIDAQVEY